MVDIERELARLMSNEIKQARDKVIQQSLRVVSSERYIDLHPERSYATDQLDLDNDELDEALQDYVNAYNAMVRLFNEAERMGLSNG